MKTITIDNKHYIPARVVMLATKDKSTNEGDLVLGVGNYLFLSRKVDSIGSLTKQHLYLICDLPIEEGDWMLDTVQSYLPSSIERASKENIYILNIPEQGWKKVIAATDTTLRIPISDSHKGNMYVDNLPQFPQSFIKEFVERQGKDVDVLIEVEEYIVQSFGLATVNGYEEPLTDYRIRLNSDNTVNLIFK